MTTHASFHGTDDNSYSMADGKRSKAFYVNLHQGFRYFFDRYLGKDLIRLNHLHLKKRH